MPASTSITGYPKRVSASSCSQPFGGSSSADRSGPDRVVREVFPAFSGRRDRLSSFS